MAKIPKNTRAILTCKRILKRTKLPQVQIETVVLILSSAFYFIHTFLSEEKLPLSIRKLESAKIVVSFSLNLFHYIVFLREVDQLSFNFWLTNYYNLGCVFSFCSEPEEWC